jgi:hypothetical protein
MGFTLAEKFSCIAQAWGNKMATAWGTDIGFAQYLAVLALNSGNR